MITEKIRLLIRRTGVFGISGVLSRVSGLITFPLLTKSMGVEPFGQLDYYLTIANLIAVIGVFGLDSAATRFFFDSSDHGDRRRVMSQVMSAQVVLSLLLAVAGIFAVVRPDTLGLARQDGQLLSLTLWHAALITLAVHLQNMMIWREQRLHYMLSTVGQTLLILAMIVFVTRSAEPTPMEMVGLFVVVRFIALLQGVWACRDQFTLTRAWTGFAPMLRFAWPVGIVGTLGALMPFVERQSIASLMNPHELGLYAAATRLATFILLPISAFQIVWVPFALSHFRDPGAEALYRAVLKVFAVVGGAMCLGLFALASPLLTVLATPQFIGAQIAVFPICFALVVKAIGDIAQLGIDISRRSHLKLLPFGLMTVLSLILVPILTHAFGIAGAAWGTVISFAGKALTEYRLAQSVHPLDWHGGRVLVVTALSSLFGIGAAMASAFGAAGSAIVGLGGALSILLGGWWLVFDRHERVQIGDLLPWVAHRRRNIGKAS